MWTTIQASHVRSTWMVSHFGLCIQNCKCVSFGNFGDDVPPLPRGRHSQGEPLYSVKEHFINLTSVSANHYYFNQFQLLLTLWSAWKSSFLFQLKTVYFHQSDFYLGRIPVINPASIYTAFFSLDQLLLDKDSLITPASIYIGVNSHRPPGSSAPNILDARPAQSLSTSNILT